VHAKVVNWEKEQEGKEFRETAGDETSNAVEREIRQ